MVREEGLFGLLATNTISQGDTREVGLDQLLAGGWSIIEAWKSRLWPGDASIQIAQVWRRNGDWDGPATLDGIHVRGITSSLDPKSRISGPAHRLVDSFEKAFIGSLLNGIGFILQPEEAEELLRLDPKNRDVLYPYLNGDDLNSSPTHSPSRWVVNFFDWPLERAEEYPDCLAVVRERVKPQRDQLGESKRREREAWWQFERRGVNLYQAIERLERVIAITRLSKTVTPVFVPAGIVYSDATVVFAYDDEGHLGLMTSAFHWWWAVRRASTMRTDLRYTPTDCFETFPHPRLTEEVAGIANALDEHRRRLMIERNEGLTKTYNRVHDQTESAADVLTLREHHVGLDHAVATAYGWNDLDLHHDFHETPQGIRYTVSSAVQMEMFDRLLALNHQRDAAESAGVRRGGRRWQIVSCRHRPTAPKRLHVSYPGVRLGGWSGRRNSRSGRKSSTPLSETSSDRQRALMRSSPRRRPLLGTDTSSGSWLRVVFSSSPRSTRTWAGQGTRHWKRGSPRRTRFRPEA